MTSRDRTERFKELRRLYKPHSIKIKDISTYLRSAATTISHRANAKLHKSRIAQKLRITDPYNSDESREGKSLLDRDSDELSSSSDDETEHKQSPKLPSNLRNALQHTPRWLALLSDIDRNISIIQKQLGILKQTHRERLRIQFDDELYVQQDIQIEETTKSITALFHDSHSKLKQIAITQSKSNIHHQMDPIQHELRLNAMKSRAVQIQQLTTVFRHDQRVFLEKLKDRESRGSKFIQSYDLSNTHGFNSLNLNLDKIEQGLTKQQLMELEAVERDCDKRTKEIINISKSVSELAQIFRDLSVLIVEQGSVLDRIDYNVEQTLDRFTSSKKHIDKAQEYQKKSSSSVVILFLLIVIAVCIVILVLQHLV
eukprot:265249_1